MTSLWSSKRAGLRAQPTLGCMNFGGRTDEAESKRILARALERGVVAFDTANRYQNGGSERIVGAALAVTPAQLATKAGMGLVSGKPEGLGKATILASVDASLKRLGRERVELLYFHAPDPKTPIDESLDAIEALFAAGKIDAFALSNFASWQFLEVIQRCDARGLPRPIASQVLYNLAVRQVEIEHLAFAAKYAVHVTIFNPLAGGLLAGKLVQGAPVPKGSRFDGNALYQRRYLSNRMFSLVEGLKAIAESEGRALVELAYGWVAQQPGVDSILLGPASVAQLDAALDALETPLSAPVLARIAALQKEFEGTEASYAR